MALNTEVTILEQILSDMATIGGGNFTPLNSTNLNLAKADLDNIDTQAIAQLVVQADLLASVGMPVIAPVQYTMLDYLREIAINTNGGGTPVFNGATFNQYASSNTIGDHDTLLLPIGPFLNGNASYFNATNPNRITVPSTGMYRIAGNVNVSASTVNEMILALYINATYGIGGGYFYNTVNASLMPFDYTIHLNANDYFQLDMNNYNGSTTFQLNNFCVEFLGEVA